MEGKIDLLYRFFFANNLLSIDETTNERKLVWTGDENTYVVQCGDQLDSDELEKDTKDTPGAKKMSDDNYYILHKKTRNY